MIRWLEYVSISKHYNNQKLLNSIKISQSRDQYFQVVYPLQSSKISPNLVTMFKILPELGKWHKTLLSHLQQKSSIALGPADKILFFKIVTIVMNFLSVVNFIVNSEKWDSNFYHTYCSCVTDLNISSKEMRHMNPYSTFNIHDCIPFY